MLSADSKMLLTACDDMHSHLYDVEHASLVEAFSGQLQYRLVCILFRSIHSLESHTETLIMLQCCERAFVCSFAPNCAMYDLPGRSAACIFNANTESLAIAPSVTTQHSQTYWRLHADCALQAMSRGC